MVFLFKIFGFANMFLWGASMWFVYKETMFHRKTLQPQPQAGDSYPGIATGVANNNNINQFPANNLYKENI